MYCGTVIHVDLHTYITYIHVCSTVRTKLGEQQVETTGAHHQHNILHSYVCGTCAPHTYIYTWYTSSCMPCHVQYAYHTPSNKKPKFYLFQGMSKLKTVTCSAILRSLSSQCWFKKVSHRLPNTNNT